MCPSCYGIIISWQQKLSYFCYGFIVFNVLKSVIKKYIILGQTTLVSSTATTVLATALTTTVPAESERVPPH